MRGTGFLPVSFLRIVATIFLVAQLSAPLAAQSSPVRDKSPRSSSRGNGVITGRVVTDDGRPASDAVIQASPIGGDIFDTRVTECDDEGNFNLTGLKPVAYRIEASLPGYVDLNGASGSGIRRIGENLTIPMSRGGAITGRVTDVRGEPLEGVFVNLQMVRDPEGRDTSQWFKKHGFLTDDRGVYRIYELPPGVYVVSVVDIPIGPFNSGSIPHDAPTYYPSAKRETASEVVVRGGIEATGIDIRHRAERGYSITGKVSGYADPTSIMEEPVVVFINESSKELVAATAITGVFDNTLRNGSGEFGLHGIPDGVYELRVGGGAVSAQQRITIKGADITGVSLRLVEPGLISGRVVIEAPERTGVCGGQRKFSLEEFVPQAKSIDGAYRDPVVRLAAVNEKGDFVLMLVEGRYRIAADLPGDNWYLKAVKTAGAKNGETTQKTIDIARDGVSIKPGAGLLRIEVRIAEGAASLRGQVAPADDVRSKKGASRRRAYLVPAEEAAADEVLRYAETIVQNDGSFELRHLAPGKYFLLVRQAPETGRSGPPAWDSLERAKLRREAQALQQEVELRPCQQSTYTRP